MLGFYKEDSIWGEMMGDFTNYGVTTENGLGPFHFYELGFRGGFIHLEDLHRSRVEYICAFYHYCVLGHAGVNVIFFEEVGVTQYVCSELIHNQGAEIKC